MGVCWPGRSGGTIEKYVRDACGFLVWLDGREVTKETVMAWKEALLRRHKAVTVNAMLAAVNGLLEFLGWSDCRVKAVRVQRETFRWGLYRRRRSLPKGGEKQKNRPKTGSGQKVSFILSSLRVISSKLKKRKKGPVLMEHRPFLTSLLE